MPAFSQYGLQTLYGLKKLPNKIDEKATTTRKTYLTKFLYRIQTLFLCQKHTAVGPTWQSHLLQGPCSSCLKEAELSRYVLCWKHTSTIAMELPYLFPSLPSVRLDRIVMRVLCAQDGVDNVGKIQLLKANRCLHLHAKAFLISIRLRIITPTEKFGTFRT